MPTGNDYGIFRPKKKYIQMKNILKKNLMLFALPFLFACNSEKKKTEPDTGNSTVEYQLKDKEEIISNYIKSFNEIQDNLNEIKSKENIVSLKSQNTELLKLNKDQIINDIKYIYDLLNRNRRSLIAMTKKFKELSEKNNELQKFIFNLTAQIIEQEKEIASLKNKFNTLKTELDLLKISEAEEKKESDYKTDELNRVYCAIGSLEGLKKEGLINEKGGLIGLGKTAEINPNLDKGMFSVLDMNKTTQIPILAKEIKLITFHPSGSFLLEDSKLKIKKLIILDTQKFWSISKYLIIQVSND